MTGAEQAAFATAACAQLERIPFDHPVTVDAFRPTVGPPRICAEVVDGTTGGRSIECVDVRAVPFVPAKLSFNMTVPHLAKEGRVIATEARAAAVWLMLGSRLGTPVSLRSFEEKDYWLVLFRDSGGSRLGLRIYKSSDKVEMLLEF
jgi:hypothetical protein